MKRTNGAVRQHMLSWYFLWEISLFYHLEFGLWNILFLKFLDEKQWNAFTLALREPSHYKLNNFQDGKMYFLEEVFCKYAGNGEMFIQTLP